MRARNLIISLLWCLAGSVFGNFVYWLIARYAWTLSRALGTTIGAVIALLLVTIGHLLAWIVQDKRAREDAEWQAYERRMQPFRVALRRQAGITPARWNVEEVSDD